MCGIAGFICPKDVCSQSDLQSQILEMTNCMVLRGPDENGIWTNVNHQVALGHRRLSIIDLSQTGSQPMVSASGRYVLAFNGEIYNYRYLADNLKSKGIVLKGTSDTEALIESIDIDGFHQTIEKCVGMFAIALWDQIQNKLILARDRFGEKPLYYSLQDRRLFFASTPRALKHNRFFRAEIDRNVLGTFFKTNYIPAPYCIYKDTYKLLPGTYIEISTDEIAEGTAKEPVPYWQLSDCASKAKTPIVVLNDDVAILGLERLLEESLMGQMISDVPLGAFLSGGIDSSLIVALMQRISSRPVKTFTIGFSDIAYDESIYAREVARHIGTDHTEKILHESDALAVIPNLPKFYDEPFADSSMIPTHLVSQIAKEKVTVALTGDGGDEIFCGYNRQVRLLQFMNKYGRLPHGVKAVAAKSIQLLPKNYLEAVLRKKKTGVLVDQLEKLALILNSQSLEDAYFQLTQFWISEPNLVLNSNPVSSLLYEKKPGR